VRKQKVLIDEAGKRYVLSDAGGGKRVKRFLDEAMKYGKPVDDVWDIDKLNNSSKEKLGYPTQKPTELLERIIHASSNEGDWILDPFCGCGTTVAVAERLRRRWAGIDISMLAVNVISQRLKAHYRGIRINIDGIPMDYEGAYKLAQNDKYTFQDWAISLIGANPPTGQSKKGADRGVDGLILFYDRIDIRKPQLRKIIVQVKGGGTNRGDVAKLKGDMDREDAPMGVLITLNEPTPEMKRETALAGEYRYSSSTLFPKIQILSIKDWFDGRNIKLPTDTVNPFRQAAVKADQKSLF
jgi:site-specific DNA-methyltransferase (adenine-specific)